MFTPSILIITLPVALMLLIVTLIISLPPTVMLATSTSTVTGALATVNTALAVPVV